MIKRSEKTIISFKSSDYSVRLIQVHDYRPFDRYQIIVNRRVFSTWLSLETAKRVFCGRVNNYVLHLNLL